MGIFLGILGLAMIVVGPIVYVSINNALDQGIKDSLVIEGTDDSGYDGWRTNGDAADPVQTASFFIFNVTNLNDVLTGATPIIKEVGPYTYLAV